jgi:protoporphyrinogen oxidase
VPHIDTLILGAGPTGLGAAWRLQERGEHDWLLLDAGGGPGGMAASERDPAGFVWDLGGHVIHSHFAYFDAVLSTVREWANPRRGGWVWLDGTPVPTPIQRHLGWLPGDLGPAVVAELGAAGGQRPANLEQYFLETFGPTLTAAFFAPYNEKMWAHPCSTVDHRWTSMRSGSAARNIPEPAPSLERRSGPDDTSRFPYPYGGTGSMWADIAGHLPAERQRYGVRVVGVDLDRRVVRTADGTEYRYGHCISSIPLRALLTTMVDDAELRLQGRSLLHSSVHAVGLGFDGEVPPQLAEVSWIYSPDRSVPFYRSTILSNYSPAIAGPGRWSVLHEASAPPDQPRAVPALVAECMAAMAAWGVTAAPRSVWHRYLAYGYPVPFVGRDELLDAVLGRLEAHGLRSRGRFGGWRYESSNQDYAFMQGVEAVDAERDGSPEATFWPDRPAPRSAALAG